MWPLIVLLLTLSIYVAFILPDFFEAALKDSGQLQENQAAFTKETYRIMNLPVNRRRK